MQDFTLPANIKQIGSIGDGIRIYMEDYVCTFLQQYAESAGFEERLAWLVGRQMVIDGQPFLFVAGAIYGLHAEKHEGHLRFTEKSVDYAEDMLDEHFPGMEIVGWMQSQPSYGTYLNQFYGAYHLRQFRKAHQVLFVMDPLERTNAFYIANPVAIAPTDRMAEITGYFIYYEKNTNMHDYMLANKAVDYTAKPPTLVEFKSMEYAEDEEDQDYDDYNASESKAHWTRHDPDTADPSEIVRRHQASKTRRQENDKEQKRAVSLLTGLCAVLFLVCFMMGFGLVRNQDNIERLEAELRQLATAFRNQLALNMELAPAFADGSSQISVEENGATVPTDDVDSGN